MKATKLLTKQHEEVAELFQSFEGTDDEDEQRDLFEQIATKLAAHDAIEREIFYPACKQALGDDEETLGESLVEHGVVEFCIYKADIAEDADLASFVKVLKEVVEHHVEEEQDELFPKVEAAIAAAQLEELGARMKQRFELAQKGDFRAAIRKNLEQVLDGALETEPDAKKVPTAKKTKSTNGARRQASE